MIARKRGSAYDGYHGGMTKMLQMCSALLVLSGCAEAVSDDVTGSWSGTCRNSDQYIGYDAEFDLVLEEPAESELTGAGTIEVMDLKFRGEVWGLWAPPQLEIWFEGKANRETISLDLTGEVTEDGNSAYGDCTVWGVWGELEMSR